MVVAFGSERSASVRTAVSRCESSARRANAFNRLGVCRIYFEGVFRATEMFLNGELVRVHAGFPGDANGEKGGIGMGGGYTSFSVRLDNASVVNYGPEAENVLAVYVDPRMGSGWFYEGGGIYRKTFLHSAPPMHVETDGVAVASTVTGAIQPRATPALGQMAASATVNISTTLVNTGTSAQTVSLTYDIIDVGGAIVGTGSASGLPIAAATNKSAPSTAAARPVAIALATPELWSVGRPYLYTLRVSVTGGDVHNVTFGIRATAWTGDKGFFLNDQHVKVRGFCDHR